MVAKTSPQSSSHTVRDDNKDILKLMDHLLEKAVVKEDKNRATSHSSFTDLNTVGLKKLTTTSWLQDILTKGSCDGDGTADEEPHVMDENDQLLFEFFKKRVYHANHSHNAVQRIHDGCGQKIIIWLSVPSSFGFWSILNYTH